MPANQNFQAVVTDTNEDGTPAFTWEPWTDGHAVGFKVTRHADGKVRFVYLNPSQETFSDGKFPPHAFLYFGDAGEPDKDLSVSYCEPFFEAR
jgi:hypothetical protein